LNHFCHVKLLEHLFNSTIIQMENSVTPYSKALDFKI
jgi:hypothetical protein